MDASEIENATDTDGRIMGRERLDCGNANPLDSRTDPFRLQEF
jgi:hypothetical protein